MAQTRQQIVDLLGSIQREPNRKLGQHFMIDPGLIARLVFQAGLEDGPVVLEVGPGTGTLTEALLESGGEVLAVEIDRFLFDLLSEELAPRFPGRLHLIGGDALASKHALNAEMVARLAELARGGERPLRLVANLPYNIASPLLAELIDLTWRSRSGRGTVAFDRLVFTVQREVADRLTAAPGGKEYGPLSVLCSALGDVTALVSRISPNAFYPKPNVFSSMLRIDLPADRGPCVGDPASLHAWLDAGFGHRRKTLAASIRLAPPEWQVRLTAAAMTAGLDTARRGETLTVREYLELASHT